MLYFIAGPGLGFDMPFHSRSSNIRDSFLFFFGGGIAYRIEFWLVGYLVSQIFGFPIPAG